MNYYAYARFLQTAKELLRRPRRVVALGLLCAFTVISFGASSSAFAATSSVITPEKGSGQPDPGNEKMLARRRMPDCRHRTITILWGVREALSKLHEANKGKGDAPIPEKEREAFVKKVQGDILDHAFAPFGDERALDAFRKNIKE